MRAGIEPIGRREKLTNQKIHTEDLLDIALRVRTFLIDMKNQSGSFGHMRPVPPVAGCCTRAMRMRRSSRKGSFFT